MLFCTLKMQGLRFLNIKRSELGSPAESVLDRAASVWAFLDAHVAVPVDVLSWIPFENVGIVSLQSFTVDSARPNSCRSMVTVVPSAYLSARRRLISAG